MKTITLDDLLEKTSRTFALSIPVLPEPTRREVMIAYLLFRIADTFEDAVALAARRTHRRPGRLQRTAALLLAREGASAVAGLGATRGRPPCRLSGADGRGPVRPRRLFRARARRRRADPRARHPFGRRHGFDRFSHTRDGRLTLHSIPELKDYCYIVAGIVGEMLTELFLLDRPALASLAPFLRERAATFGEALQLVNILKDSAVDAEEGRRYLPAEVPKSEVFSLARE